MASQFISILTAEKDNLLYTKGPLLLTWFNFNPSMDKQSYAQ